MLWTLLGHNNTRHVSLEPKMAVPSFRIVIGCILDAFLARTCLVAGRFGCVRVILMLITMQPIDLVPIRCCDPLWHIQNLAKFIEEIEPW